MNNPHSSAPKSHLNTIQILDCRNIKAILAISKHLHVVVAHAALTDKAHKRIDEALARGDSAAAKSAYEGIKCSLKPRWNRKPDSENKIREKVRDHHLAIYNPGSPESNTKDVVVIDIDAGGKKALKRIGKLLSLNSKNSVVTLSGKKGRFHVWVHVKDASKVIGKKIPWEAEGGSGEVLHDHGVVAWNPSDGLLKFLEQVRKGKVSAVDVTPLVKKNKRKNTLPADCSPELTERIEKYVAESKIAKNIQGGVLTQLLIMGAAQVEKDRNNTLWKCSKDLGRQYSSHISGDLILKALHTVARWKGLGDREIQSTINSGWNKGVAEGNALKAEGKRVRSTDGGNIQDWSRHAKELVPELSGKYIYEYVDGKWYAYLQETHWQSKHGQRKMDAFLVDYTDEQVAAGRLRPARYATGIEKGLRAKLHLPDGKEWNFDPYLVGLPDGRVWDARTNKFRDGCPEDYINKTISVTPRKGSKKERKAIKRFMIHMANAYADIPGLREEIVEWLHTIRGLCYIGKAHKDAKILWLYSDVGNTGKSTFIDTLLRAAGKYCAVISDDTMSQRGYQDHPQQYAALKDKRGVVNDDAPRDTMKTSVIKKITTGSTIVARHMGKENFEFVSCATLYFASNFVPLIEGDGGMKRRLAILQTQLPEKKDSKFIEYITSEKMLEVWAYWDLKGAHRAVSNPASRDVPVAVQVKSDELLGENDVIDRFTDGHIKKAEGEFVSRSELEAAFQIAKGKYGWREKWSLQRFRRSLANNKLPCKEERRRKGGIKKRGFDNIEIVMGVKE